MRFAKLIGSVGIALVIFTSTQAQYFGKNKAQYTLFNWQFLQSEHFDVYFTEGGEGVASFVAEVAEDSYEMLRKDFRYDLKDRITIIAYNSHNDFGQTNVDLSPPEESVGGFTEFFKNRMVIPYEGEWEKFRHVIHHELTHAVMLQMVYGAGVQAIVSGLTRLQLPLWFIEGLAEYESRGWDTESDMFMRDAALNGYTPEIPMLYGFMAYKGGQSVLYYLAEKYGDAKIGELLGKVKINRNFERGMKQAIGIGLEDLSKRWHRYLKRKYWPDIADRKEPDEIGKRLTDHKKDNNFINSSPALSPKGDKLVFLSDRSDYFDIYLMSAIDGRILAKLVSGQRAGSLEELKWMKGPNITWSPDGKFIAFSAKAGKEDALHIVDVKKKDIVRSLRLDLDGIFYPSWSPKGDEIAFSGTKYGQSDIYSVNLETEGLRKITDDIFSDVEPSWSQDGAQLVFASDRGQWIDSDTVPDDLTPVELDYKNYDIYQINADGSELRNVVSSLHVERIPVYSPDGTYIAFTSDRSGVTNIYIKNLESDEEWPITNILTGAFQPTWSGDGSRMVFTSFYYAGYDLFLLKNPLKIKPGEIEIQNTGFMNQFLAKMEESKKQQELKQPQEIDLAKTFEDDSVKYQNYIFDQDFAEGYVKVEEDTEKVFLEPSDYRLPSGKFRVHDYEVKFSPDIVYGTVGYSQFYGTQGYTVISISDVLGNNRMFISVNLFSDFRNSDYSFTYFYLPRRIDYGFGAFHNAYFYYSYYFGLVRDRNYGASLSISRPFSKYNRLELGLTWIGIQRTYMDLPDDLVSALVQEKIIPPTDRRFLLSGLTWVNDNTIWGYTGPINGGRSAFGVTYSPGIWGEKGLDFATFRADWRRYLRLKDEYHFVVRGAGGFSEGVHPQKFFLGGVTNWLNYKTNGGLRVDNIEEIYFASWEMPLRGARYYELDGNRFLMANLEFRFPLIRRLQMGFPLPLYLWNVRGALFTDLGMAWDKGETPKPFKKSPSGFYRTNDLFMFMSFGLGARLNMGWFVLQFDLAWPTDLYRSASSPHILWSLGAEF